MFHALTPKRQPEGLCPNRNPNQTTTQGQEGGSTMKRILIFTYHSATSLTVIILHVLYSRSRQLHQAQTPLTSYPGWARSQATNSAVVVARSILTKTLCSIIYSRIPPQFSLINKLKLHYPLGRSLYVQSQSHSNTTFLISSPHKLPKSDIFTKTSIFIIITCQIYQKIDDVCVF